MLEWMIAITAVCGAVSGLAILYIALRAGLQMRSKASATRRAMRERVRLGDGDDISTLLPRATVHRVSPTLGMRRLRRFNVAQRRA
jgi:hypothetical protein